MFLDECGFIRGDLVSAWPPRIATRSLIHFKWTMFYSLFLTEPTDHNLLYYRHEVSEVESGGDDTEMQIQVQNTKLGISTFWSLEKFQSNLAAMRELEQVVQHK